MLSEVLMLYMKESSSPLTEVGQATHPIFGVYCRHVVCVDVSVRV